MNRVLIFNFKTFYRNYHSSLGVYGFKPRSPTKIASLSEKALKNRAKNCNLHRLAEGFQKYGCRAASLNPLASLENRTLSQLNPAAYGLDVSSQTEFCLDGIISANKSHDTLENIVAHLKRVYCDKIGVEFVYLEENEREWFAVEFEKIQTETCFTNSEKKEILSELLKSQVFDNFLATKFSSVKRYGAEGAESMMAFFVEIFKQSSLSNLRDVIIGIPHRGRLNLLTGLLQYPPVAMFQKMMGFPEFPNTGATCDVLSHLTSAIDYKYSGKSVHVTLLPNPSHLEAVSPVAVGYARSRLQSWRVADYGDGGPPPVLPIQVHGDASFTGQGVVMETLALSNVPNFSVGGSIHLVVNNQIGFTTPQHRGRSSTYCSDLMKMISAPVIHVNGDFPEEVLKATLLAFRYRQRFQKDVLVDLLCFRRWGHNELDDPTFTNPTMYSVIRSRKSVPDLYADMLLSNGVLREEEISSMHSKCHSILSENLKLTESYKIQMEVESDLDVLRHSVSLYDTGVDVDLLKFIGHKSVQVPPSFDVHPTLRKNFIQEREKKLAEGGRLDWATAEALAIGSILYQGHNVRLSGQDVGRGTFSQRHAMLVDQSTGEVHVPLNNLHKDQSAFYEVANSLLSEEGVLGFEYGFSVENTDNLVVWEAQFGDFFNSAQVVFDTMISSGERKWLLPSRIVVLLPHGYDGAGPEHSSSRMERFLQMSDSHESEIDSDDVNWHIVNPTTPAQYFHILRHQMLTRLPKSLIVIAPKILLRHPQAVSSLHHMTPGTCFQAVLEDDSAPENAKKVIFCTGKHYYFLQSESEKKENCAIVRIEKLCPFPAKEIHSILLKYKSAKTFIWSQEEPRNMGAWSFVQPRFQNLLGCKLQYAGRKPLAAVAVGAGKYHQEEVKHIVQETFQ